MNSLKFDGKPSSYCGRGARQELLHHAGAGADFRRLSERLSPARLAVAWSHVATRLRGEGRAEGAAMFMAAEPAMLACVAALLPEMDHISTLIVVGAPRGYCVLRS